MLLIFILNDLFPNKHFPLADGIFSLILLKLFIMFGQIGKRVTFHRRERKLRNILQTLLSNGNLFRRNFPPSVYKISTLFAAENTVIAQRFGEQNGNYLENILKALVCFVNSFHTPHASKNSTERIFAMKRSTFPCSTVTQR